jgi:ribonuclease HI
MNIKMAKNNYYVVWNGRKQGIFSSWQECKKQVSEFEGAKYKGFTNLSEAKIAFSGRYEDFVAKKSKVNIDCEKQEKKPNYKSISVDAACSGNPGNMEYRGVWTDTRQKIFHSKVYKNATNNIGEFLAIVHALALCRQNNWDYDIFSDSVNAQLWIKNKKCKTKLEPNTDNEEVFDLIFRAEQWLNNNDYPNKILKWHTNVWGEIPADFGRK